MTSSTTNLLDLPHAILEHVATELPLPGVGCYACVCSLLRQLITANAAPCWHVHLDACKVASDEPRPALRALTTLDCARWIDVTPRFVESDDPHARPVFSQGQPDAQVAHTAFTCNDGNTLIIVGVQPRATVLSAWAVDVLAQPCRWREAAETTVEAEDELLRDVGVDQPAARHFTADGGGGGVLRDKAGREWLCLFGGLIVDATGQSHHRDNETWLLGPLGEASGCGEWRWWEVQADGNPQSDVRPTPRFHHSQTVLKGGEDVCGRLAICGGTDYTLSPLLALATLSLGEQDLAPPADGAPGPPPALSEVVWEEWEEEGEEEDASGPGPEPRERHAAASWGGHGLLIVGGEDGLHFMATAWLYQAHTEPDWVQLPDLPAPRSRASAAVVREERLVVCGGTGGGDPTAVWVLSLLPGLRDGEGFRAAQKWSELSLRRGLENPRLDATLCVAHGDILVLGGGHSGQELDQFGDATGNPLPHALLLHILARCPTLLLLYTRARTHLLAHT